MHEFNKQFKAGMYLFQKIIILVQIYLNISILQKFNEQSWHLERIKMIVKNYQIGNFISCVTQGLSLKHESANWLKSTEMAYIAQSCVNLISGLSTYDFIACHRIRSICKSLKIGGETQFDQHNFVYYFMLTINYTLKILKKLFSAEIYLTFHAYLYPSIW